MDINILIGIIGLLVALIGLKYSRKSFKKEHIERPQENILHLKAQFKATQKLSKDLYHDLKEFATKKSYFEEEIWPGVTYNMYLQELLNSQNGNLSDEVFDKISVGYLPEMTIQSMSKSLEEQFNALTLLHNELKIKSQVH